MVATDITNLSFPDESFSVIYASHVLEHVENDHRALREFYRVLKKGGWGMFNVPIVAEKTYEDLTIRDPEERKKHFGQKNHVRLCGPDYVERMKFAGFMVETFSAVEIASERDCLRMGFSPKRLVFLCSK